ncbi:nitrous oxide reductase accessory protein NosL [Roseateles oligotrophus]|uniref:Nitrous oxide reductase accessory protein NosL n=1 Tax=Roseateles oligotrophus TaxID=1769250 RepID=A0ABT2YKY8_9BURK|nr:nitrous oxide reductase accessory protein NosL [Roseateles oligotrophus]MCV2370606.1 nitrous oxide reductase accessory protein NosL [Roseateles oligotrophus]
MLNFCSPSAPGLGRFGRLAWASLLTLALAGSLQLLPGRPSVPAEAPPGDVCLVAPPTPYDPRSGLDLLAARAVPPHARCPVCGMFPARSLEWAAQVIFADNGEAQFFDSPLSLFIYLQDVARFSRGRNAAEIGASYVTDASSGALIRAETAIYVQGSDALGPMRAGNLPAFADAAGAQAFADKRGGALLRFEQIDAKLLTRMDARGPHRH